MATDKSIPSLACTTNNQSFVPAAKTDTDSSFLQSTSLHGVRYITAENSKCQRVVWLCLLIAVSCYGIYNLTDTLIRYYKYDSYFSSKNVLQTQLRLPAITICNMNNLNLTKMNDKFPILANATLSNFQQSPTLRAQLEQILLKDVTDETQLTLEETFVYCLGGYLKALKCENYTEKLYTDTGICTTFNGQQTQVPLTAAAPGRQQGFALILDVNARQESMSAFRGDGFLISVHHHDEYPNLDQNSFLLQPGTVTQVQVQKKHTTFLDQPYSRERCLHPGEDIGKEQDLSYLDFYDMPYSKSVCLMECIMHKIIYTNCSFYPKQIQQCSYADYFSISDNFQAYVDGDVDPTAKTCSYCYKNCKTITFQTSLSSSNFPNRQSYKWLKKKRPQYSDAALKENLLELQVFYETTEELHIEQIPAMTTSALISNIGGVLGFFLGASVITFAEFLNQAITLLSKKMRPFDKSAYLETHTKT